MKREFKAESKKLLDLMINSIYTNKEIFLRELISNSSDAIDKVYLTMLREGDSGWNPDRFTIDITPDKEARTLVVEDHGIGMNKTELDENLGTIAKSGTLDLKENVSAEDLKDIEIIGQFGVGFYSSFMVADKVVVETRKYGEDQGYRWESSGVDGYTIEEMDKDEHGTKITLFLKEKDDDEDYDMYLENFYLTELIKKYSNYIRYPIRLPKEEEDGIVYHIVNSRVPIWKRNRDELTEEDYKQFYRDEFMGFDDPLSIIHFHAEGLLSYRALLFIPSEAPFNYYVQEQDKGLALYANGVMIMEQCEELLPDYFGFVKGVVDSEDLSLNISREMLQKNRQLSMMAKRIETKVKEELGKVLEEDRDAYNRFFDEFGRQLKVGIYQTFGAAKDVLEDLLLYSSSLQDERITLKEYVEGMKEDQEHIYYAAGSSLSHIKRLPQTKRLIDQGYPVLYLDDEIDEFVIKAMNKYDDYDFKNVSSEDVDVLNEEEKQEVKRAKEDYDLLFKKAKEHLGDKVSDVVPSTQLEDDAACLTAKGELSIEMEKLLAMTPEGQNLKADKVLELNIHHDLFKKLDDALMNDEKLFNKYVDLIYNQSRLIEGLPIENPVAFVRDMNSLM